MPTAVFLKLKQGRRVRFGQAHDAAGAKKVKADVLQWIHDGITLTVANAQGEAEDITANAIADVELVNEQ
jgi:hypothetical protein